MLGAWGCGAFKNPPEHIAELFHRVMEEEEFRNRFRKIVFAILSRRGPETGNLAAFQAEFSAPAQPGQTAWRKVLQSLFFSIRPVTEV